MRRLVVCLAAALLAGACSSGGGGGPRVETTSPLRVADVPAAVAALEQRLGGPQRYTEVNATPDGVNLFVSSGQGRESAWFYRPGGGLEPPATDGPATGQPFSLAGVDLAKAAGLVTQLQAQFPGSVVTSAALVQLPTEGLVWALRSRSAKGGQLDVLFSPDGRILSASPSDPVPSS